MPDQSEAGTPEPGPASAPPSVSSNGQIARNTGKSVNRMMKKKKRTADDMNEEFVWPWVDLLGMTEYESKEQRLHDEIVAYASYISPTAQEQRARKLVMARVGELVRRRFPNSTLTPFGSITNQTYLPGGDVDLLMIWPRELDLEGKKKTLYNLSGIFRNASVTQDTLFVFRARVPIMHFETVDELGSLHIDISVNSPDGVKLVPIMEKYLDSMPALRYLVLVVKGYLSQLRLNSAQDGGLSSYSLMCLVISFLQRNPKQRPTDDIEKPLEYESLGRLLMDFLDHYGNEFDYTESCVSVTQGKVVSKKSKGWDQTSQSDHLSIECLVNSNWDIGRPTGKIKQVRTAFHNAHMILQGYPFSMAHTNALGAIVGISPETVEHREHLKQLVDSGDLERNLASIQLPPPYVPRRQFQPQQPQQPQHYHHNHHQPNQRQQQPMPSYQPHPQHNPMYQQPAYPYNASYYGNGHTGAAPYYSGQPSQAYYGSQMPNHPASQGYGQGYGAYGYGGQPAQPNYGGGPRPKKRRQF